MERPVESGPSALRRSGALPAPGDRTREGDEVTGPTHRAGITRISVMAVACLTASVLPAVSAAAPAGAAKAPAPHYYLALGDWLATGIGASRAPTTT